MYAKAGVGGSKPTEFRQDWAARLCYNVRKSLGSTFGLMALRLLCYSEIDLSAWDECVAQAREAVPYAHSWWLHATAGRWEAVVEVAADGQYRAVWPLPVKRRPWGREVYQPPFTQQLGLLAIEAEVPVMVLLAMARHYPRFYTQLNTANGLPVPPPGASVQPRQTYHLSLAAPAEHIRAGYCADYRRRLRLNESALQPLRALETRNAEPLLTLFQQTQGAAAGLKPRHYTILRRLIAALAQRQLLELHEIRHPQTGALLAGALFVRYRTRLIYLFAAASVEGKKAGAPLVLVDAAIGRHADTSELVLDFEGGMIPSIARFFANFGAGPVPYAALSFTQRPWYLTWMR